MKPTAFVTAIVTVLLAIPVQAAARAAAGPATPLPPATVPSSHSYTFVSAITHERYGVDIFIPDSAPPPGGFPALYVLDGNVLFSTFASAMHNKSQAAEIEPAVVVGIRSTDEPDGADRTYDFTYSDMSAYEKSIVVDLGDKPRFGGYDGFYRAIEEEIRPAVGRIVPLNQDRASLFGWSLGGLFVVHTLLMHPEAFHGYIALSPSIWRNNRDVLSEIPAFEHTLSTRKLQPRLFLGVGSLEEQLSPGMTKWKMDQTKLAAEAKYARMVGNAEDLSKTMGPFFADNHLAFLFRRFEGDTHNSVPWSAVNPALDFEFPLNDQSR